MLGKNKLSILSIRQIHQAISTTNSIRAAAAALNKPGWKRNPSIFVDYLTQLGTSYDELKSLIVDSEDTIKKFPNYREPVKKKRMEHVELDIDQVYAELSAALLDDDKITINNLAESFKVSPIHFCNILVSRGLSLEYLRLNPGDLERLYDKPRVHNGVEYSLAEIHQAILENIKLHPSKKGKITHAASAALLGVSESIFERWFYQLVNRRNLKNHAQEMLNLDDLAKMSLAEARLHFGINYRLTYEFELYSEEIFLSNYSIKNICEDIQKTKFGVTSLAFYYGMSNPSVLTKLLKKFGVDAKQLFSLGFEEAQQLFGNQFDAKFKDLPKNGYKKVVTMNARASTSGFFSHTPAEELLGAPLPKKPKIQEDDVLEEDEHIKNVSTILLSINAQYS